MTDNLRGITPGLVDGPYDDEFANKIKAVQDEIAAYIDKTYPVYATDSKEIQRVLNMTLGTVLIAIGITKIKDSGTNPISFLQDLLSKFNLPTKE